MFKSHEILQNSLIAQKEGNIVSDMDGEKVMMSIKNGKYYNLGEIGGVIWDLIRFPITFNELIITLINEYEVDNEKCEEQVLRFLEMLQKEELIQITD
jgi:hypothetical protein